MFASADFRVTSPGVYATPCAVGLPIGVHLLGEAHRAKSGVCRLCEMALEETVAHFMAAVLTFSRAITEEGVQTLQADRDQLVAFFQQHCKPDKVVKLAAPLQDLKDVAAADSVDTFVLTYTTLLQVCPKTLPANSIRAFGYALEPWVQPMSLCTLDMQLLPHDSLCCMSS